MPVLIACARRFSSPFLTRACPVLRAIRAPTGDVACLPQSTAPSPRRRTHGLPLPGRRGTVSPTPGTSLSESCCHALRVHHGPTCNLAGTDAGGHAPDPGFGARRKCPIEQPRVFRCTAQLPDDTHLPVRTRRLVPRLPVVLHLPHVQAGEGPLRDRLSLPELPGNALHLGRLGRGRVERPRSKRRARVERLCTRTGFSSPQRGTAAFIDSGCRTRL